MSQAKLSKTLPDKILYLQCWNYHNRNQEDCKQLLATLLWVKKDKNGGILHTFWPFSKTRMENKEIFACQFNKFSS